MPNASRSQWLSVKPARQDGATRAGLELGDERLDRVPQRRLERRARAALRLEPLELPVALAEHGADRPLGLGLRLAREQAAVDVTSQSAGMTLRCCEAEIIVGVSVRPSSGSRKSAARGRAAREASSSPDAAPRR